MASRYCKRARSLQGIVPSVQTQSICPIEACGCNRAGTPICDLDFTGHFGQCKHPLILYGSVHTCSFFSSSQKCKYFWENSLKMCWNKMHLVD